MIVRRAGSRNRRGMAIIECAVVYPIVILLLIGTMIVGLGVFRYQQLQSLAREGARYASVHGPAYAAATGNAEASTSSVLTYVDGFAVGMNGLNCTSVSYSSSSLPCTVSVTLTYTWVPEGLFGSISWSMTSTMPVSY